MTQPKFEDSTAARARPPPPRAAAAIALLTCGTRTVDVAAALSPPPPPPPPLFVRYDATLAQWRGGGPETISRGARPRSELMSTSLSQSASAWQQDEIKTHLKQA